MYEFTVFENQFDNQTHRKYSLPTWDAFCGALKDLSELPVENKRDAPLISPAIYKEGTTRANANVDYWGGWCALDVDDVDFNMDTLENDILQICDNIRHVCYSTASSSYDKPKFRLVFDLGTKVDSELLRPLWFAVNRHFASIGDGQTKDGSRMYYVPATYAGSCNFFFIGGSNPLDIDAVMEAHPYIETTGNSFLDKLSPEMREQVIQHRKDQMTNTSIKWSSYRDCPFFPKTLAAKYQSLTDAGWYHTMYCIMVAIASNAIMKKYPITEREIADLCREFDLANGNWYSKRPLHLESRSAIEYAYRNTPLD
jgi:hypothetical protein